MDHGLQRSKVRKVPEGPKCTGEDPGSPLPHLPVEHFRIPGCNLDAAVGDEGAGTKL